MIGRSTIRSMALALALLASAAPVFADSCDTSVASALASQQQEYIASSASLADENYSRRSGTFAATTCLDTLMKSSGTDIFFKPPSLDTILNLVKNFACQQATQIFNSLVGGSGVNGSVALKVGELLSGISLNGTSTSITTSILQTTAPASTTSVDVSLKKLFQ